jgi:hypothetical protein
MTMLFAFDLESFLLSPGCQAPPPVSLQFCLDDGDPQLIHARDPAFKRWLVWAYENALMSAHGGAFDHCVVMAAFPDLIPLVFDAFDADRVVCTIVRQKLLEIAMGRYKALAKGRGSYTLDGVAQRLKLDLGLDKNDPWRLRYGTLYNLPISQWPADALAYALKDATAQRAVHRAQDAYADRKAPEFHRALGLRSGQDLLRDQFRQTRAALWLRLMEVRGIMVDPQRVEEYIENTRQQLKRDQEICIAEGLVRGLHRPAGYKGQWKPYSRDMAAGKHRMVEVCRKAEEIDLPITDTGEEKLREMLGLGDTAAIPPGATWKLLDAFPKEVGYVKLDEDACDLYGDEVLEAFQRCGTATTQIARAERLRHGTITPIQASFQTLIDSGRTACRQGDVKPGESPPAWGSQLQNPAKDKKRKSDGVLVKGTRECFVSRGPGQWFDPLYRLPDGTVVGRWAPTRGYYFCPTDYNSAELCGVAQLCIWKVGFSKLAEVINEGRDPHTELGATLARISVEEAYARRNGERVEALKKHFDDRVRQTAKVGNFGFWGAMGPAKMVLAARKQYGIKLGAETEDPDERVPWEKALRAAKELRDAWFATWPEARKYFNYISDRFDNEGYGPEGNRRIALMQPVSYRVRGGLWYSQAANTGFQALIADIKKDAFWQISREMYAVPDSPLYGSRNLIDLHDELFSEVLIERAHEAAHRQAQIQIEVASKWAPDVRWGCEPAITTRWYKAAEAVYMANGRFVGKDAPGARLVPWTPETPGLIKAQKLADQNAQNTQERKVA